MKGTVSSLAELMVVCHAALYRYARALCHDPEHAQELVQETYKRALGAKRKPSEGREEEVRAWLFTILRHIWQNEARGRAREAYSRDADDEHAEPPDDNTPEVQLLRRMLHSEVRQAIDALPATFREVIVLREIEGLSYHQIAGILQCPSGTVMSRLARARTMLRHSFLGAGRPSKEKKQ